MKILHLIQCANLGGMEQTTLIRMRYLMRAGHSSRLLSLNPIGKLGPLLQENHIPFSGLDYAGVAGWRTFRSARNEMRSLKPDAVLMTGHNLMAQLALGRLGIGRRVLAIHHYHAGVKPKSHWRAIYRLACSQFDAIIFPTDYIRTEAEALYPPVAQRSHTVRNPFELPALPNDSERDAARTSLGIPSSGPVVGCAGWLIAGKRTDVFLQTAKLLLQKCVDCNFVVAGDGPEAPRLRVMAEQLGIAHRIKWLGWQLDMKAFFLALDAFVFNSDFEALGRAPLEAATYGVPVVASVLSGGLGEIIDNDGLGYLYSTHDAGCLAECTYRLLTDPALARRVGLALRARLATMSPEADSKRMISLLNL